MTTQLEQLTLAQVASLIRLSKRVGEINSLLSGVGAPGSQRGAPSDWYIDTTNNELYGPKGSNYWPTEGIPLGQPSDGKTMLVGGGGGSSGGGGGGTAGTITIGTVTTVAAGDPATVTNVGTPEAAILNFNIPSGATGSQGATAQPEPPDQQVQLEQRVLKVLKVRRGHKVTQVQQVLRAL